MSNPQRVYDPRVSQWYVFNQSTNRWHVENSLSKSGFGAMVAGDVVRAALALAQTPEPKEPVTPASASIQTEMNNLEQGMAEVRTDVAEVKAKVTDVADKLERIGPDLDKALQILARFENNFDRYDPVQLQQFLQHLETWAQNTRDLIGKYPDKLTDPEFLAQRLEPIEKSIRDLKVGVEQRLDSMTNRLDEVNRTIAENLDEHTAANTQLHQRIEDAVVKMTDPNLHAAAVIPPQVVTAKPSKWQGFKGWLGGVFGGMGRGAKRGWVAYRSWKARRRAQQQAAQAQPVSARMSLRSQLLGGIATACALVLAAFVGLALLGAHSSPNNQQVADVTPAPVQQPVQIVIVPPVVQAPQQVPAVPPNVGAPNAVTPADVDNKLAGAINQLQGTINNLAASLSTSLGARIDTAVGNLRSEVSTKLAIYQQANDNRDSRIDIIEKKIDELKKPDAIPAPQVTIENWAQLSPVQRYNILINACPSGWPSGVDAAMVQSVLKGMTQEEADPIIKSCNIAAVAAKAKAFAEPQVADVPVTPEPKVEVANGEIYLLSPPPFHPNLRPSHRN